MSVQLHDVFCVHRTAEGDAAALQGTTLSVRPGELLCVLGPSGAGKSTLLRVIAGLQTPSAGEVRVLGQDMGRLSARARARLRHLRIGFLGQRADAALSPDASIDNAIMLPLALRGASRARRRRRLDELLEATGLRDAAGAFPGQLSGGERQRAALCVALAHEPELLLADEPTGELDELSAETVRELIGSLVRAQQATAIVVSHDPVMAEIADRAVRIRDGRLVEDAGALVVGRGGWIRLPPELLGELGIGDRVQVRATDEGVVVTALGTGDKGDPRGPEPGATNGPPRERARPADLELRSVTRLYGRRRVLDGVSVAFTPARMTVVTGRSGSGKTTLLRLLAGLDRPDDGQLLIDGQAIEREDDEQRAARRRERIGYLPQEPAPVGFLSAEENVVLALRLRGWEQQAATARAIEVLARLGLADRARQRVERLSAGEAQRVALARALASARGLLIVDEPTSRLDETTAGAVAEMLAAVAADEGQTVVCATHDPQVIRHAGEVVAL
ncbi:MAG: ATP-binding cassette domain-containing protein [Solirubrobacteraceae bacterium]